MSSFKRALKFQNIDFKKSVVTFWAVLIFINVGSYVSLYKFSNRFIGIRVSDSVIMNGAMDSAISIAGANIIPLLIFFIIYCYETFYEYFPIALSFSTTRKDFYKSAIVYDVTAVALFSLIQGILMKADTHIVKSLGAKPKVDFGIFNSQADSLLYIVFSLFICFMVFVGIMNLLGALNYKVGYKLWIGAAALMALYSMTGLTFLNNLYDLLFTTRLGAAQLSISLLIITACYTSSYLTISRTNVKNKW